MSLLKKTDKIFVAAAHLIFIFGVALSFYAINGLYSKASIYSVFAVGLLIGLSVYVSCLYNKKHALPIRSLWMLSCLLSIIIYFASAVIFERWFALHFKAALVVKYLWLFLISFGAVVGAYAEAVFFVNPYFAKQLNDSSKLLNRALRIVLLLAICAIGNVFVKNYDSSWNLSFLKKGEPSASTMKIIEKLEKPMGVGVFFEQDSEVLDKVRNYFASMGQSKNIDVHFYDKYYNPRAARDFEVAKNGYAVLRYNGKLQPFFIGETVDEAKKVLKKLDKEFARRVLELSSEQSIVYFTQGHGEASWGAAGTNQRKSIRLLELVLKQLNYSLRTLDINGGLAQDVPENADLVVVVSPDKDFLQSETDSLKRYVQRGGSILFLADVRSPIGGGDQSSLKGFVSGFGLDYDQSVVADTNKFVRITRGAIDHWYLFANNYGIHPAVEALSLNESNLAVIFFESGSFSVRQGSEWKVTSLIKTYKSSFLDKNRNYKMDGGEEEQIHSLGFALEKTMSGDVDASRVAMIADASVVSDELMRNTGNAQFIIDIIKWLSGREALIGSQDTTEDKPILRSGKEDRLYFQLSIFVVPVLILLMGLLVKFTRFSKND